MLYAMYFGNGELLSEVLTLQWITVTQYCKKISADYQI